MRQNDSSIVSYSTTVTTVTTSESSFSRLKINESDDDESEVFQDATSDISVLARPEPVLSSCSASEILDANRRPAKLVKATHRDLCIHTQKVQEPLFLRKCDKYVAKKGIAPPNADPILKIEKLRGTLKKASQSFLLPGLDSPTFCARYMARNVPRIAKEVLILRSPLQYVRFVVRPEAMLSNQSKFVNECTIVKLMMSPEQACIAKKMIPKWKTVTFTLAYGKHVAVKYRVMETRKQDIQHIKTKVEKGVNVPTKTLYRVAPIERAEMWKCAKPQQLRLSTVEKCDPQMVKKAFLESLGAQTLEARDNEAVSKKKVKSKTENVEVTTKKEEKLDVIWTKKQDKL